MEKSENRNCNLTPMPASAMLGFVFDLVTNCEMTHEERTILLRLELLNRKLEILNCHMSKKLYPTEETVQEMAALEESLGTELKGLIEQQDEKVWLLRSNGSSLGGGRPRTEKIVITNSRGESLGAKVRTLCLYLQIKEECDDEPERLGEKVRTLMFYARTTLDLVWICGYVKKKDTSRSSSGARRPKKMDRRGIG